MTDFLDDLFRIRGLKTVVIADSAAPTVVSAASAKAFVIEATGTVTAPRAMVLPHKAGAAWVVYNGTAYALTVKGPSGSGTSLEPGERVLVYSTGSSFARSGGAGAGAPDVQSYTVTADATLSHVYADADLLVLGGAAQHVSTFPISVRDGAPIVIWNQSGATQTIADQDGSAYDVVAGAAITLQRAGQQLVLTSLAPFGSNLQVLLGTGQPGNVPAAALPAPGAGTKGGVALPATAKKLALLDDGSWGAPGFYGAYASRPAAGSAGRRAVITDTSVAEWVDDSAAWRPIIGGVLGYEPPALSGFTSFNLTGTAAATQHNGSIMVVGNNDGANFYNRGWAISCSGTTAYIEACLQLQEDGAASGSGWSMGTIMMREAGTAKAYVFCFAYDHSTTTEYFEFETYSNNTTRATNVTRFMNKKHDAGKPIFARLRRDATNVYAEYSRDRQNWFSLHSASIASTFTSAPDTVGFGVVGYNFATRYEILSLKYGT